MLSAEFGRARVVLSRRSLVRGLSLLLAAAPVLGACSNGGFRPLYGETPSGAGLQERLRQVDVSPIPGRVGQRIRNDLIFQTSGGGELLPPTHRLELVIAEVGPDHAGQDRRRLARHDLCPQRHFQADQHQGQEGGSAGLELRPCGLRALPVDLLQRARARRRREPRRAHRGRRHQDARGSLHVRGRLQAVLPSRPEP